MSEIQETFISHLVELRDRLLRAVLAIILVFLCLVPWAANVYDLLAQPMIATLPPGTKMIATGVITPFMVPIKITLLAAFIIALPVVLYQAWAFIAPGLYPGEKKLAVPFVLTSTLLFVAGAFFGHRFVFPAMFTFLGEFESEFVQAAWSMREVWSMTTSMFLAFGVAFQLPVVVFFLASAGILTVRQLLRYFPYAILINFVIGAVLTPSPDWVSQSMLAVPMCVLYLLGVGVAWLFGGKRARGTSGEKPDAGAVARV